MKEKISENIPEEWKRVEKLKESDNSYEDSIYDLADKEKDFRKMLGGRGLDKKIVDQLADKYSDEVLEKLEAGKERWIDGLTGLRNRNALNEEIPQLLSMEKRRKSDCSMLMVDFDLFKKVNDEFGHAAGDQALKAMAEIIKKQSRTADAIYRYGGEEFVAFLPNTTSTRAAAIAERIRQSVEAVEIEITDKSGQARKIKKTVSIGCIGTDQLKGWAGYKDAGADDFLKSFLTGSDRALYGAKQSGRNRVVVFDGKTNSTEEENKIAA